LFALRDGREDATVSVGSRILGLTLAAVAMAAPVEALQADLARYYDSVKDVCRTGVTTEMISAYDRAHRALEQARPSSTPGSNFAGLKAPEQFWLDCVQSPGDGKN
jgi:hypothetical protein